MTTENDIRVNPEFSDRHLELRTADILQLYADNLPEEQHMRAVEHPNRVVDILHAYEGDLLPDIVYELAHLHDVVDRFSSNHDDRVSTVAKTALSTYFQQLDAQELPFASAILADLECVEEAAEKYRTDVSKNLNGTYADIITNGYADTLPPDIWLVETPDTDLPHMSALLSEVNLESVLIKAAELLDNLEHPPKREAALLQDILEAEYFYAPLLEIIGFDGFAMHLRDIAARTRVEKSGNGSVLERATELHTAGKHVHVAGLLGKVLGNNGFEITHATKQFNGNSPSTGEFVIENFERLTAGNWRIKTIGSIAIKMVRNGLDEPMDILALTVIDEDNNGLTRSYHGLTKRLDQIDDIQFRPAPSKDRSHYVQGSSDFVQTIESATDSYDIAPDRIQTHISEGDIYEVAKMTLDVRHNGLATPVEIQFVTKETRKAARIGKFAHILYKQSGVSTDVNPEHFLELIHERKSRIRKDRLDVNGQSKDRADAFVAAVSA